MARQTIKLGELVKTAWQKVNANFEELYNSIANKVDKEAGKGLSTNDFTDAYKTKVDNAASVTKKTFTASGWGTAGSDGYYSMSIAAAGKYPVKVMRNENGTYTEALVQTAVNGNNVVITAQETFEGYLIVI